MRSSMHDRSGVRTMSLTRVVLATGRSVDLAEVRFTSTYGGLDGYPCKPFNDLVIKGLLSATERSFPATPVHLPPPPRPPRPAPARVPPPLRRRLRPGRDPAPRRLRRLLPLRSPAPRPRPGP